LQTVPGRHTCDSPGVQEVAQTGALASQLRLFAQPMSVFLHPELGSQEILVAFPRAASQVGVPQLMSKWLMFPVLGSQKSSVQAFPSSLSTGTPGEQSPFPSQVSLPLHRSPSSQLSPTATGITWHFPLSQDALAQGPGSGHSWSFLQVAQPLMGRWATVPVVGSQTSLVQGSPSSICGAGIAMACPLPSQAQVPLHLSRSLSQETPLLHSVVTQVPSMQATLAHLLWAPQSSSLVHSAGASPPWPAAPCLLAARAAVARGSSRGTPVAALPRVGAAARLRPSGSARTAVAGRACGGTLQRGEVEGPFGFDGAGDPEEQEAGRSHKDAEKHPVMIPKGEGSRRCQTAESPGTGG
jgi:hypothetical protein